MSDINLVRRHSLPIAKAKTLVQKEVDALSAEYDLSSEWHGNTLHFHRSGLEGRMHVTDSEVRLHATLGFLLRPFRGKLIDHVERSFDRLLPEREPAARAGKTARTAGSGH
jgi:putative polyhydroxyalkanoate system protein